MEHKDYMLLAIKEAKEADAMGEVPVGCVIADAEGTVIASAHNLTETKKDATAHAELLAIAEAQKKLGRRLGGCTLYVTLEPCPMCAGAILLSRISNVVFGARDWDRGALLSNANLSHTFLGADLQVLEGISEEGCEKLLKDFFARCRESKN
ncbi:nucleoside deaminase [bacterium]|nr:nucleoside deaminase [bacterium]